MEAIAEFLGIEFSECLLQPTRLGGLWKGNSSRGIEFFGISTANLEHWRAEITDLEISYVNRFFDFLLEEYGYDMVMPQRSHHWPVRCESLKIYLANRLIPFYL